MKTIKNIIIIVLSIISLSATAQNKMEVKFEQTFKTKQMRIFNFITADADVKVHTWDKKEVKLIGKLNIDNQDDNEQENIDKFIDAFRNPIIKNVKDSLAIKATAMDNFALRRVQEDHQKWYNFFKTTRIDLYWIKNTEYELWIPNNIKLYIHNRSGSTKIDDFKGNIKCSAIWGKMNVSSFTNGEFVIFDATANIGKGNNATIDSHHSTTNIKNIQHIKAETTHSTININKAVSLKLESIRDKVNIENIQKLSIKDKYSNFQIESNMKKLELDSDNTKIKAKNIDNIRISGKYSNLNLNDAKLIECGKLHEVKIFANKVGKIHSTDEIKYGHIKITEISQAINIPTAYQLRLVVEKVADSFTQLTGKFKYGNVKLPLPNSLDFSINYEAKYTPIRFPKSRITNIKNNSKFIFSGTTSANPKCKINITGYKSEFDFE